ncbi:hypothetical protein BKA69DRAFT_698781 [Paraphysoderma sedebokerense]|nr:hypothetical protein BKA69DRAFT_698781 [Paraphysoderma sedebokerense]
MTTTHQSHSLYNNHHHHHHHHLVSLVHFCELNGPSVIFVTQPTLSGDNSTHHPNSHSNPDNQSQSHQNSNPNLHPEDAVVGSQNLDSTEPHVHPQPQSRSSNRTRAKSPLNSIIPSSPQSPQHHTPSCPACSPWYPAAAELPTVLKECVDAFPSFVCMNNEAKNRSRQGSKGDIEIDEKSGINDDGNGGIRSGTGHDSAINIQINVKQPISPISPASNGSNESEGNNVKSVITSDPLVEGTKYFSSRYPLEVGIYSVLRTACVRRYVIYSFHNKK